jgi:hypothetical protein
MSQKPMLTLAIPVSGKQQAAALERTLVAIHQVLSARNPEVLIQIGDSEAGDWALELQEHASSPSAEARTDRGIYDAMNRLTERANGERILFLGAGDIPLAGLDRALDRWREVDDVLELGGVRIPNAEPRVPRHYAPQWDRGLCWRNVAHHQGIAYPLQLLRTFGGFALEYPVLADYALNLEMWQEGVKARWNPGEDWTSAAPGGVSRKFNAALYSEERLLKQAVMRPGLNKALQPLWIRFKSRWKRS